MKILTNIIRVAMSNLINLGSSFIIGFILPVYLSISEYGMYKEYTLFLTFLSLFNFGYNDGVYIKYGGKSNKLIDKKQINDEHSFVLLFQLIIFFLMLYFSYNTHNIVFLLFSITTFVNNVSNYHLNFYQATGNFKIYSNINIIRTIIKVSNILFVIFVIKSNSFIPYIIADILANIVIFLTLELYHYSNYGKIKKPSFNMNFSLFRIGMFILIANTIMGLVGNLGSWVVNFLFNIEEFAYYSFSTSILNIVLMIVNSISLIFYNVIAQKEDKTMLIFVKRILLILGVIAGMAFFIFKFIILVFMKSYIPSLSILSITFISMPYIMVINVIILNLYKVMKKEKMYLRDMLIVLIFSIVLMSLFYIVFKTMKGIAFATTIVYISWYIYSVTIKFKYLIPSTKEIVLLLTHFTIFYTLSNYFNYLIGSIIYFVYLLIILLLFKDDLKKFIFSK